MKHCVGGCCDCGEANTIAPAGFCDNHKGFDSLDQNLELNKIPEKL